MKNEEKIPKKVSLIIPAYNESDRIGKVLAAVKDADCIGEIIVVDDGSKDSTYEEVCRAAIVDPRIKALRHATNLGKGQALFTGFAHIQTPYVLMLDSDLQNLKSDHISALVEPVTSGKADMTLGLFWGGRINTDLAHVGSPFLTGQRCMRADLMHHVNADAAKGYGVEIAITVASIDLNYRVKRVKMPGVWHPPSEFHRGFIDGILWRMNMYRQIFRAWKVAGGNHALRERYARKFQSGVSDQIDDQYKRFKERASSMFGK